MCRAAKEGAKARRKCIFTRVPIPPRPRALRKHLLRARVQAAGTALGWRPGHRTSRALAVRRQGGFVSSKAPAFPQDDGGSSAVGRVPGDTEAPWGALRRGHKHVLS